MSTANPASQYDILLYGATGYTGKLTAEYITRSLPTSVKWAVSGRNQQKLSSLLEHLKALEPSRPLPEIEIADLEKAALNALVKKARLVVSAVGPFHQYGTPIVAACAENGIHYIDCTGEPPWVKDMISKYHTVAEKTGAIMIPQCGIDSVPADLTTYLLVKQVREALKVGVKEVILSVQTFSMIPSGGTINTAITLADTYSFKHIRASMRPFALSPEPHPNPRGKSRPLFEKITGVRTVPSLGVQTDSLMGSVDRAQVGRSWGLFDKGKYYGDQFRFHEYSRSRNVLTGMLWHFALMTAAVALIIPGFKFVLKKFIYQPGQGPEVKSTHSNTLHFRGVAYPDDDGSSAPATAGPKRAIADFIWVGSGYYFTGLLMVEAAMLILSEPKGERKGGFITPAMLKEEYAQRIQNAGIKLDVRMEQ